MSSRTSAASVTIIKQKNGSVPSVLSSSFMKQPSLSKDMSASTKGLKSSSKRIQPSKQEQQSPKQKASAMNGTSVSSTPTTLQQRRTVLPVKARRVERRKEIVSMTEAIKIDLDTESDDSTSSSSSSSSCRNDQRHNNMIHATTSTTILSAEIAKKREYNRQKNRRRSNSVIDIRNSHVYAGPTFNNAPAPSALPIPAFSPTLLSVNLITTDGKDDLKRHSQDLMNLLSTKPGHREFDRDLSEIQRGLRSMLKI